jgi:AcrR family transcriptional regulator
MPEKRAEILDIAVALADERGLAAVSMRAIAERVGVTPMALYPYVGNKAALLDGMLGRLLGGLLPPAASEAARPPRPAADGAAADGTAGRGTDEAGGGTADDHVLDEEAARGRAGRGTDDHVPDGAAAGGGAGDYVADGAAAGDGAGAPWPDRLTAIARRARAVVIAHPWAASLIFARPAVTPDSVRTVDLLYTALLDAGVPAPEVPRLERMLSTVVIGFAASEAGGRFGSGGDPRSYRGLLPSGVLPGHARLSAALDRPVDWDAEFEADLADLRLLIEAIARPRPGPARP